MCTIVDFGLQIVTVAWSYLTELCANFVGDTRKRVQNFLEQILEDGVKCFEATQIRQESCFSVSNPSLNALEAL